MQGPDDPGQQTLMSNLLRQLRDLPRAAKWAVFAAAALVAYFVIVEPVVTRTGRLNAAADTTAAALTHERDLAEQWSGQGRPLAAARSAFGAPALPGPDAQRKQALYQRVNQILDKHKVARPEIGERYAPLRDDRGDRFVDGTERIDRLILDLTFEADPATVVAVLSDLEQCDEVAAVSRVQLRRLDAGRSGQGSGHHVRAVLSPEAWVRVSTQGGGRS